MTEEQKKELISIITTYGAKQYGKAFAEMRSESEGFEYNQLTTKLFIDIYNFIDALVKE